MIVNVATFWGLTIPSYKLLNALVEEYKDQDFQILGFPSNDFYLVSLKLAIKVFIMIKQHSSIINSSVYD